MTDRRTAAAHVFVSDLASPFMDDIDEHHVTRVLRVRPGESVTVSDGQGSWRVCAMAQRGGLEPSDDRICHEEEPSKPITIAFGMTKADKPETVVQKLTEIGAQHIVPVLLDRSIVRWDENKIDQHHARFTRVAREAAMQSRRVFLPTVHRISRSLDELLVSTVMLEQWGRIALAEPSGHGGLAGVSALIVGPEGGFSERELALVEDRVTLVDGILRAETAAIAAGLLLVHASGGS